MLAVDFFLNSFYFLALESLLGSFTQHYVCEVHPKGILCALNLSPARLPYSNAYWRSSGWRKTRTSPGLHTELPPSAAGSAPELKHLGSGQVTAGWPNLWTWAIAASGLGSLRPSEHSEAQSVSKVVSKKINGGRRNCRWWVWTDGCALRKPLICSAKSLPLSDPPSSSLQRCSSLSAEALTGQI